jgi:hypothetical protein
MVLKYRWSLAETMDLFIDTKDLDRLQLFLASARNQLPYAQSRALNSLAYETRHARACAATSQSAGPGS